MFWCMTPPGRTRTSIDGLTQSLGETSRSTSWRLTPLLLLLHRSLIDGGIHKQLLLRR